MGLFGDIFGSIAAPFTGGASLLGTDFGQSFVTGKNPSVQSPFAPSVAPLANLAQNQIGGLFNNSQLSSLFGANPLESSASQSLQGLDPNSFFSGMFGGMNTGPTGSGSMSPTNPLSILGSSRNLFSQAGSMVGSDPFGANPLLSKTVGGGFTDPNQNPFYQAQAKGATDSAQRFLDQQFDQIAGGAQKAGGGVANSSILPQYQTQAATNVATQLGAQLAGIQGNIYEQERGRQQQGLMEALGLPLEQAGVLGQLGSGMGQLGLGIQGQDLQRLGMLANLGSVLQGRQQAGFELPFDELLKYLSVARGVALPGAPSPLAQLLGGAGQAAYGGASLFGGGGGGGAAASAAPVV